MLACVCLFSLATVLALSPVPALAKEKHKPAQKEAQHVSKEPFGDIPKGPIEIFVSIDQQKLHLYSDGMHVADTSVATGVPSLPTPLGVFSVIQKQVFHRSNIYSGAPMPFMQRITWSGVALHEGENIGHRASHGCIRMPRDFAMRLYQFTKLGARVIVADGELKPSAFADPHLFVHKVLPPAPPAPVAAGAPPVQTAQATDDAKTTDAVEAKLDAPISADAGAPAQAEVAPESVKTAQSSEGAKTTDAVEAKPDAPAVTVDPPKSSVTQTSPVIKMAAVTPLAADYLRGTDANPTLTVEAVADAIPVPLTKPAEAIQSAADRKTPISIFVSRKTNRIYVRQNFEPLFDAAITVVHPEQPLGTHVFTALAYLDDGSTFRWDVVSLPGVSPKQKRSEAGDTGAERHGKGKREEAHAEKPAGDLPTSQTPADALARIDIPQDIVARISELMVPGSSLIVSDQGLGEETGEGTDFIVVSR